jgi:THO complex subunit 2
METYNLHPILMRKKAAVQKDIKRIMQRISKENVKPTSRALGKKTHSSPGLLFEYVSEKLIRTVFNFINILRTHFFYVHHFSSLFSSYMYIEKAAQTTFVRKTLRKLTPVKLSLEIK